MAASAVWGQRWGSEWHVSRCWTVVSLWLPSLLYQRYIRGVSTCHLCTFTQPVESLAQSHFYCLLQFAFANFFLKLAIFLFNWILTMHTDELYCPMLSGRDALEVQSRNPQPQHWWIILLMICCVKHKIHLRDMLIMLILDFQLTGALDLVSYHSVDWSWACLYASFWSPNL